MAPKINTISFFIILFILASICFAKAQTIKPPIKEKLKAYWVYFTDKNCSANLMQHPAQFLSTKSLARRINQKIEIDESDLPVCVDYLNQLKKSGFVIIAQSKWLNAVAIQALELPILKAQYIKKVEPARQYHLNQIQPLNLNSHTSYNKKIKLIKKSQELYGATATQLNMLGSACLHQQNYWGAGLDIAVLDAGFLNANNMEAFQHVFVEGRVLSTYDFVEDDTTVFDEGNSGHGTVVWSAMAAVLENQYSGAAPKANYHLLKTEDTSSETLVEEFNWIEAIEYADSAGVDIINSSLGYSLFDDTLQNHTYADMDGNTTPISIAADFAAAKGMLVVTSAGNSGTKAWTYITAPADADSILSVGSVDADRVKSNFSSFGPSSDGDIKPEVAAMGSKTIVVKPNGEIDEAYGTSISSPLVAGMAACLWQKFPNKNNMDIIELIKQSSSQYQQPDTLLGYGIPDFCSAQVGESVSEINDLVWVYPNPFSEVLFITIFNTSNETQLHSVNLYNLSGQLIEGKAEAKRDAYAQTITFPQIDQLSPGIYYLQYATDNRVIHHYKLLKLNVH